MRKARLHTGRHKVLSTYRSYHGGTQLVVNITGDPRRWASDNDAQMTTATADHAPPIVDVVVVGAGATGLTAATELVRAGNPSSFPRRATASAADCAPDTVDGVMLELGGPWVSPDQAALLTTIDGLGVAAAGDERPAVRDRGAVGRAHHGGQAGARVRYHHSSRRTASSNGPRSAGTR